VCTGEIDHWTRELQGILGTLATRTSQHGPPTSAVNEAITALNQASAYEGTARLSDRARDIAAALTAITADVAARHGRGSWHRRLWQELTEAAEDLAVQIAGTDPDACGDVDAHLVYTHWALNLPDHLIDAYRRATEDHLPEIAYFRLIANTEPRER
jgi:hypothetical protein